jgi:hypothetical protein
MIDTSNTIEYGRYHLLDVYDQITPELTQKIVVLWQSNGVLPAGIDPTQRVKEVAVVILDKEQNVVGVSTVYIEFRPRIKEHAFMYRMFIQPQDRMPGMMVAVIKQTYALLNALSMPNKPTSMMNINENSKLIRPGTRRQFERMGYTYLGTDPQGHEVWRWLFTETS